MISTFENKKMPHIASESRKLVDAPRRKFWGAMLVEAPLSNILMHHSQGLMKLGFGNSVFYIFGLE